MTEQPKRPPRRPVTVSAVERTTPRSVRVTVRGELGDWPEPGPAAYMKIFLPETSAGAIVRTYTVRHFDRDRGEVDIDIALHEGNGPTAQWATTVVPGAPLELSGLARSTFTPAADGGDYLFAGDESALPAIATCLEALPASARATAIVEIADSAEQVPLTSAAAFEVTWLHRGNGSDLSETLAGLDPARFSTTWIACEAGVMRTIRRSFLDAGFPREALATRGYWKRGDANHPDHDTGDDVV